MKKFFVLLLVIILVAAMTGCFGEGPTGRVDKEPGVTKAPTEAKEENNVIGLGEKIIYSEGDVDLYSIVITSVEVTEERNEFWDSEPEQVIIINYIYENLGSEEDIFISSFNFKVIDSDGNVCDTYPAAGFDKMAQYTPIGAKCNAAEAYGLEVGGGTIKIHYYENIFSSKADFIIETTVAG